MAQNEIRTREIGDANQGGCMHMHRLAVQHELQATYRSSKQLRILQALRHARVAPSLFAAKGHPGRYSPSRWYQRKPTAAVCCACAADSTVAVKSLRLSSGSCLRHVRSAQIYAAGFGTNAPSRPFRGFQAPALSERCCVYQPEAG